MRFGTRSVAVVLAVVVTAAFGNACGNDEDGHSATSDEVTTTTTRARASTTQTSALSTVEDVLASRIREEFPGVRDTDLRVDDDTLLLTFEVASGETPGAVRAYAELAASELQTVAPEVLGGLATVDVEIDKSDGKVITDSFPLGDLLPVD